MSTIFICCTQEKREIAQAIQSNLNGYFEVQVWDQSGSLTGGSVLTNLIVTGRKFDFAILILTPDGVLRHNGQDVFVPRDNIILEAGFFIGLLGLSRTFLVCEDKEGMKLPSDLNGIIMAKYKKPEKTILKAALGPACYSIKEAINNVQCDDLIKSPGTSDDAWTNSLVRSALKVVCNALQAPLVNLNAARLRAFIFQKQDNYLICTHFWALRKVSEKVGMLKFEITEETAEQVAVVKAAIKKETIAVKVEPLKKLNIEVDKDLFFVLAAPIIGQNGEVWGTVDIDAASPEGAELLRTERAKEVLFDLGRHLYIALTREKNHCQQP